jgi:dTDP-4-amino-4,6-dideoxygalactose transaminase
VIHCANPKAQYLSYKAEIDEAVSRVLDGGWYVLGEEVSAFEDEFARYIGVSYGVGTGSGTEALHLALKSLGIGAGDEVITVSHTAVATVAAIGLSGAEAVLCDIEPEYYTIDPALIKRLITPRTKAIVPVHLYGQPVDMEPVMDIAQKKGLRVVEDCAQATGALYKGRRVGSFGDMACFSFYPTKNLGAFGDGGMVVTGDADLLEKARLLGQYGWKERFVSHACGWNTRLDEVQAAVLRVKLEGLDRDNKKRAEIAAVYNERLGGVELVLPLTREAATHVYHLYVVRSKKRDALLRYLREKGVGASVHYPVPVHMQPAYKGVRGGDGLSVTEAVADEIISLPMYPELGEEEVQTVASAVKEFLS